MGYEIKLIVGERGFTADEIQQGELILLEGGELYRPYMKDEKGVHIKTGRKETFFQVYAMIDICKPGYESAIIKVDQENKDESTVFYFYFGNDQIKDDKYGTRMKPIAIQTVIDALEKDAKSGYRRFKWALGALRAIRDNDGQDAEVMIYGY